MSFALRLVKSTRIFVADAECKVIGISASIISKKRTPFNVLFGDVEVISTRW